LVNGLNVGAARDREAFILLHAFDGGLGHARLFGQLLGGPLEISPSHSQLSASNHRSDRFYLSCDRFWLTRAPIVNYISSHEKHIQPQRVDWSQALLLHPTVTAPAGGHGTR